MTNQELITHLKNKIIENDEQNNYSETYNSAFLSGSSIAFKEAIKLLEENL